MCFMMQGYHNGLLTPSCRFATYQGFLLLFFIFKNVSFYQVCVAAVLWRPKRPCPLQKWLNIYWSVFQKKFFFFSKWSQMTRTVFWNLLLRKVLREVRFRGLFSDCCLFLLKNKSKIRKHWWNLNCWVFEKNFLGIVNKWGPFTPLPCIEL